MTAVCTTRSRMAVAVIEALESRQFLSGESMALNSVPTISTFDGVGFQRNPVAELLFKLNDKPAAVTSAVSATVNFGDGTGWVKAELAPSGDVGWYIVKASHVYKGFSSSKSFLVETKVTAGEVSTDMKGSTKVTVSPMHATAARPGSVPPVMSRPQSLRDEVFGISNVPMLHASYAGVGFSENTVAAFYMYNNGVIDTNIAHFKAQVNFGDSPNWYQADIAPKAKDPNRLVIKNQGHVYTAAGTYAITVVLTGPDGETHAQTTTSMPVYDMPSVASRPAKPPVVATPTKAPTDISYVVTSAAAPVANVGKSVTAPLAYFSATVNGVVDTLSGDFKAFVNWGDSPNWETATIGAGTGSGQTFAVSDSHTFTKAGNYDVVVFLVAVDGTTVTQATMQVHVI